MAVSTTTQPLSHAGYTTTAIVGNPVEPSDKDRNLFLDPEKVSRYLNSINSPPHRAVMKKIIENHIFYIPKNELTKSLTACLTKLNQKLLSLNESTPLILATEKGKSQEWVASLVSDKMARKPSSTIELKLNGGMIGSDERMILGEKKNFVIFDDCSYSFQQLHNMIESLYSTIFLINQEWWHLAPSHKRDILKEHKFSAETAKKFFFVIPFVTKIALRGFSQLKEQFAEQTPHIEIELIAHRVIPSITDIPFKENEKQCLRDLKIYREEKVFGVTEWKVPDFVSMPVYFTEGTIPEKYRVDKKLKGVRFLPNIQKPYPKKVDKADETPKLQADPTALMFV